MASPEKKQPLTEGKPELLDETAVIVYHLFEDPRYFLEWGAKGAPFYLAYACAHRAAAARARYRYAPSLHTNCHACPAQG